MLIDGPIEARTAAPRCTARASGLRRCSSTAPLKHRHRERALELAGATPSMLIDGPIEARRGSPGRGTATRLRRCSSTAPLKQQRVGTGKVDEALTPSMLIDGPIEA